MQKLPDFFQHKSRFDLRVADTNYPGRSGNASGSICIRCAAFFSAYSLIVEPKKTVFLQHDAKKGKLPLPSEEHEAQMYEIVMDEMEKKNGYHQYEISNFFQKRDMKAVIILRIGTMRNIMDLVQERTGIRLESVHKMQDR
ncbi:hypothetical protein GCM10020331_038470 [Ectobacillus funiculus]